MLLLRRTWKFIIQWNGNRTTFIPTTLQKKQQVRAFLKTLFDNFSNKLTFRWKLYKYHGHPHGIALSRLWYFQKCLYVSEQFTERVSAKGTNSSAAAFAASACLHPTASSLSRAAAALFLLLCSLLTQGLWRQRVARFRLSGGSLSGRATTRACHPVKSQVWPALIVAQMKTLSGDNSCFLLADKNTTTDKTFAYS